MIFKQRGSDIKVDNLMVWSVFGPITFNEEKSVTYIVITLCMETTYVCIQCISLLLIALHTQEAKITRAEDVRVVF